jgi:hypothetical protein
MEKYFSPQRTRGRVKSSRAVPDKGQGGHPHKGPRDHTRTKQNQSRASAKSLPKTNWQAEEDYTYKKRGYGRLQALLSVMATKGKELPYFYFCKSFPQFCSASTTKYHNSLLQAINHQRR